MNNPNLEPYKQRCLEEIEEAFRLAEYEYDREIPRVPVIWQKSLTSTAGMAQSDWEGNGVAIYLSPKLLALNPEEFVSRTPRHEAAHIISCQIYGIKAGGGHGARWREVMAKVGGKPSRCHSMRTPGTLPMHCGCRLHWIKRDQVMRIRSGEISSRCKKCKINLQFGPGDFEPGERRKVHPVQRSFRPESNPGTQDAKVRDQLRKLRMAGINDPQFVIRNEQLMQAICEGAGLDRKEGRRYVRRLWNELT